MRPFILCLCAVALFACPRPRPTFDAGSEEDAGIDAGIDAGWPQGDNPPTGWSVVAELPAGAAATSHLGVGVATAPDQHGQPLVAYVEDDPNGDGSTMDARLFFTRWDGVKKGWTTPKLVEVVGGVDFSPPHRPVSLARDDTTGRIGIAYVKRAEDSIRLAYSDDDGVTFSLVTASRIPTAALLSNPSLTLSGGTARIAHVQGGELMVRTWTGQGDWTESQLPGGLVAQEPVSLALDSAGNPGVAFFKDGLAGVRQLVFWRPGVGMTTTIATSGGLDVSTADRRPSVSLTFVGEVPHVAFHLRNEAPMAMNDQTAELFYAKAADASGTSWSTPVAIPRNGDGTTFHSTRYYQGLTVEPSGRISIAADFAANGVRLMYGGPKLARSTDGATFVTTAPTNTPAQFAGDWLSLWQHAPGKLTIIFHYDNRSNPNLKPGVVMWREP